jgi:hypothetical protein
MERKGKKGRALWKGELFYVLYKSQHQSINCQEYKKNTQKKKRGGTEYVHAFGPSKSLII